MDNPASTPWVANLIALVTVLGSLLILLVLAWLIFWRLALRNIPIVRELLGLEPLVEPRSTTHRPPSQPRASSRRKSHDDTAPISSSVSSSIHSAATDPTEVGAYDRPSPPPSSGSATGHGGGVPGSTNPGPSHPYSYSPGYSAPPSLRPNGPTLPNGGDVRQRKIPNDSRPPNSKQPQPATANQDCGLPDFMEEYLSN
ncbi:hypothetical protein H4R33_003301 [Dimargaris cristalligena]|uniref:Uncharacterized protein n=1 Tax=Dimargaris cristalligena TaxID=215637 RepID=A0A4V1J439_9FUNG|nr:hypothetical protein H4R33_003301 [Dimargaris cristalligena]RKP34219.1 hypothetical protein BJ085DRAFT_39900 [Dimargaris cristalligena]|eukprot:RKP34219.1 hypothetical protein BJ085DRAFT_39900 [Dimargaris cristalligena]